MDYRAYGGRYYLRVDKDDEILESVLSLCRKEGVRSASFRGLAGCGEACIAVYIPAEARYQEIRKDGLLELVAMEGNVTVGIDGEVFPHAHALFSYLDETGELRYLGGHLRRAVVSYTGEVVIDPLPGEEIGRMFDPRTGINIWKFS